MPRAEPEGVQQKILPAVSRPGAFQFRPIERIRGAIACPVFSGAVFHRPGIQQNVEGGVETRFASILRNPRLYVAARDLTEDADVGGDVLVAGTQFPRDGRCMIGFLRCAFWTAAILVR